MITEFKQFLAGLIQAETQKIADTGFVIDQKKLMASNGWENLPEKILSPVKCREVLQRVMNYIEHTPPAMITPNSTNIQKLEELSRNFMDDYQKWLVINEKTVPVTQLLEHLASLGDKSFPGITSDEDTFGFITHHIIQRYYLNNRVNENPEPEPEAA